MQDFFADCRAASGHGGRSLRGGLVSVIARALSAVVQVVAVIALARLLTPEDYGLVAMVTAVTGFAPMLVDFGTRDALAQRDQITEGEVSALFWISVAVGGCLAILVAASGPLLAAFYREPRLNAIAMLSSLTVVNAAVVCQHHGLLRRAMMFRQLSVIEIGASAAGAATAIAMASQGFGYWALVTRPIVASGIALVATWLFCRWIPKRPTFTDGVMEMLRFGIHLTGFSVTDFVSRFSDSVVIGKLFGAERLGYYRKALLIYDNNLDLTVALHNVASVSLSKLRSEPTELRRVWEKGLSTLCFYAMPIFGALAVTSKDMVVLVLGARWTTAGILLGVIALRGIPHVVERTLGWLHVAAGRSDRWLRWGLFAAVLQLLALLAGVPFGPIGVAWAYVTLTYVMFIPTITYAGKPLEIGPKDVIRVVWMPLVGTLIAVGVALSMRSTVLSSFSRPERLLLEAGIFVGTYLLVVPGAMGVRAPLIVIYDLLPGRRAVSSSGAS
ncbi:MAG: lipopolysaccharide biosynthesis protein [Bryobacteraceae bacterium]